MDHALPQKTRWFALLNQLFRYGLTTAASLAFLYGGGRLAAQAGWPEGPSYAALLTAVYVAVYLSYARYVFKRRPDRQTLGRFLTVLGLSWIANNLLFSLSTRAFQIPYGPALLVNTLVLGGFRFVAQKTYVFRAADVRVDV